MADQTERQKVIALENEAEKLAVQLESKATPPSFLGGKPSNGSEIADALLISWSHRPRIPTLVDPMRFIDLEGDELEAKIAGENRRIEVRQRVCEAYYKSWAKKADAFLSGEPVRIDYREIYDGALAHAQSLGTAIDQPTSSPEFIVWDADDADDCKYGYAVSIDHEHAKELGVRCVMVHAEDGMPIYESQEYHTDLDSIIDRMDDVISGSPYVDVA